METQLLHKELSDKVLCSSGFFHFQMVKPELLSRIRKTSIKEGCFSDSAGMAFSVHNILGPGLVESAYEGSFCVELEDSGVRYERQRVYPLHYKGRLVSAYIADLVVADIIILELC